MPKPITEERKKYASQKLKKALKEYEQGKEKIKGAKHCVSPAAIAKELVESMA